MQVQGKPVQLTMTRGFAQAYGQLYATLFAGIVDDILARHPVDMLVFEADDQHLTVTSAGYFVAGPRRGQLDETTEVYRNAALPIEKFWFRLDDHGDRWVGTFLFPSEY